MEKLFMENGYISLNKYGEQLCGDRVEVKNNPSGDFTMVLADGLGSGVKANILSTLTSKIIATMMDSDMTVEELHAIMEKWDDEKLKANEELLDAIMPHQSGVLGKLLSRKNEPEPVEPEVAVENYVRHLLLLDVQDQPPAEPSDCE